MTIEKDEQIRLLDSAIKAAENLINATEKTEATRKAYYDASAELKPEADRKRNEAKDKQNNALIMAKAKIMELDDIKLTNPIEIKANESVRNALIEAVKISELPSRGNRTPNFLDSAKNVIFVSKEEANNFKANTINAKSSTSLEGNSPTLNLLNSAIKAAENLINETEKTEAARKAYHNASTEFKPEADRKRNEAKDKQNNALIMAKAKIMELDDISPTNPLEEKAKKSVINALSEAVKISQSNYRGNTPPNFLNSEKNAVSAAREETNNFKSSTIPAKPLAVIGGNSRPSPKHPTQIGGGNLTKKTDDNLLQRARKVFTEDKYKCDSDGDQIIITGNDSRPKLTILPDSSVQMIVPLTNNPELTKHVLEFAKKECGSKAVCVFSADPEERKYIAQIAENLKIDIKMSTTVEEHKKNISEVSESKSSAMQTESNKRWVPDKFSTHKENVLPESMKNKNNAPSQKITEPITSRKNPQDLKPDSISTNQVNHQKFHK